MESAFPNMWENTGDKAIRPLCSILGPRFPKVDGKGTERAFLFSFGLRIRLGPTSKRHNPLAIFTINTGGKTLIYKRASKIYSPQRKTFSDLVPLDTRANTIIMFSIVNWMTYNYSVEDCLCQDDIYVCKFLCSWCTSAYATNKQVRRTKYAGNITQGACIYYILFQKN